MSRNRNGFFERLERQRADALPGVRQSAPPQQGTPQAAPDLTVRNAPPIGGALDLGGAAGAGLGSAAPTAEAAARAASNSWGWLPAIVLVASIGLVSVGQSMQLARAQAPGATLLLWLGLLLIYTPVAFRMALPQAPRRERIALAAWLGLALYLVKILRSPAGFTFHDEFPHFATADLILRTGQLFGWNSLQEVSAFFPGLEIVTAALASIGGISIEAAGLVVIGIARLIASLAIYLLYEEISGSPRLAGVGSVLAIAYPNYIFWSSQYSYESLALPLSMLVLLLGLLRGRRNAPQRSFFIMALFVIFAVIMTHHITSYFLTAALIGIFVVARFGQPLVMRLERISDRLPLRLRRFAPWTLWTRPTEHTTSWREWGPLALFAAVSAVLWLTLVGRPIIRYLSPHLHAAAAGFIGVITRSRGARAPFTTSTATSTAPAWEQLVAFAAVLLIVAVIPFGLLQVWRRYRRHSVALLFALATLAYPATLVLRMAGGGAEIANRSWDFLFVAIGFVLAAAIVELWMAREPVLPRAAAFAGYASILLVGALIVGTPGWARLPGPFMVGGDTRGLQPESYAATDWARETLGPGNRMIADYSNKLLLGSFGEQYIVDGVSWIYISPKLEHGEELADLEYRGVAYVVVDDRLAAGVPRIGHYFEPGEPDSPWKEPLPEAHLAKFDKASCLSRVFDSGHIKLYAVSAACARGEGETK